MRSFGAFCVAVTCVAFAACSGKSSDGGAPGDAPDLPSNCERYQAAQTLKDACDALLVGGCPQTLLGYLATRPQSYARVGCGITEIRDESSDGSQNNTYAFDETGALVGFDRVYRDDSAFCATGEYTFGTLIGACDSVRECNIPMDAAKTGKVCGCDCPDPPPDDGVFATTPDCVLPVHAGPGAGCDSGVLGELSAGDVLRYGCGFYVTGDASTLTCTYDANGAFLGASREDSASAFCAGVTTLQTGQRYVPCDAEKTCVWDPLGDVSKAGTSDLPVCDDALPDAGGNTACSEWRALTDVAASCAVIAGTEAGACPLDEQSYLAGLDDPTTIRAVVGCGITWYQPTGGGFGGSAFAFDSDGQLVGYDIWSDSTFGPCIGMFDYKLGDELLGCDIVESCGLGDDRLPTCR